jgi:hypothetical protein
VSKLGLPIVNDFASFFFTLSSAFWHFRMIKTTSFNDLQLKKKLTGSHPGFDLVDRVSPGQFPSGFLPSPGPVPGLGRPGPGSTRRAGPGFKTMVNSSDELTGPGFKTMVNSSDGLIQARIWENKYSIYGKNHSYQTCLYGSTWCLS